MFARNSSVQQKMPGERVPKHVANSIYPLEKVRNYDASWRVRSYNALVSGATVQKFWNVMLEMDGEDQSDRLCEKWRSVAWRPGRDEYPAFSNKEED